MKSIRFVLATFIACAVSLVLFCGNQETAQSAEEENHCFTCHTNARKLIKITRQIEKNNKNKPGSSAETEVEG